MSKIMDATIKMNTEIQKVPDDSYRAVVGEYIIDHIKSDADAEEILKEDKTLEKAVEHIVSVAKKQGREGREKDEKEITVVLTSDEVFALAMDYFGLSKSKGAGHAPEGVSETKKKIGLSLEDFL